MKVKQVALAIAIIGLMISSYLTLTRYTSLSLACPDTGVINCANVLSSQYSTIFGIPNAVLGIVFFAIDAFVIWRYFGKDQMIIINGVGLAFVLYYITAEFLLKSICIYCTGVHICVLALLSISIKYYGKPTS
ncbi:MAG: vitamin K epoxide reductase family protein [Candidatus Micrarchaeaceae archaeon]